MFRAIIRRAATLKYEKWNKAADKELKEEGA